MVAARLEHIEVPALSDRGARTSLGDGVVRRNTSGDGTAQVGLWPAPLTDAQVAERNLRKRAWPEDPAGALCICRPTGAYPNASSRDAASDDASRDRDELTSDHGDRAE